MIISGPVWYFGPRMEDVLVAAAVLRARNQFAVKYLFFAANEEEVYVHLRKEVIGCKIYCSFAESATTYCSAITLVEIHNSSSECSGGMHEFTAFSEDLHLARNAQVVGELCFLLLYQLSTDK